MTRLKSLLTLVVLFSICAGSVGGQGSAIADSLGLIVLSGSYSKKDFVRIYNEDGSLWHKLSFYYDESDGKFDYANDNFRPFAFHPDYFLLALKCIRREAGRYEVIVNEETGLKKYVKADDPALSFETWEAHLLKVFSVRFNREENPVREAPQGRVKEVAIPDVPFHPVEVRGEWLKIKWEATKEGGEYNSGWVRWKKGGRLLVELFHVS